MTDEIGARVTPQLAIRNAASREAQPEIVGAQLADLFFQAPNLLLEHHWIEERSIAMHTSASRFSRRRDSRGPGSRTLERRRKNLLLRAVERRPVNLFVDNASFAVLP